GDFLGEAVERAQAARLVEHVIALPITPDDVLERGGDEEVLLREAELLTGGGVVARVQHAADVLRARACLDCTDVGPLVDLIEVELTHRASAPETQRVDRLRAEARHRSVVRRREDVPRIDPLLHEPSGVEVSPDAAVELHAEAIAHARNLPGIA